MSVRMDKVREALAQMRMATSFLATYAEPALAEVEEREQEQASLMMDFRRVEREYIAVKAEADRLKAALDDIESRPEDTLRVQAVARAALAPADRNTGGFFPSVDEPCGWDR